MSLEHRHTCVNPDDYQAYRDIEDQIGQGSPEQAWAMYFISSGIVREYIARAVAKHIALGKRGLLVKFPDLAPAMTANKGDLKL